MKKLLMSICILLILSFSLIDALADTADTDVSYSLSTNDNDKLEQMVTKNTASWPISRNNLATHLLMRYNNLNEEGLR